MADKQEQETDRRKPAKAFAAHAIGCEECTTTVIEGVLTGQDRTERGSLGMCVVGRALDAYDPIAKGGAQ